MYVASRRCSRERVNFCLSTGAISRGSRTSAHEFNFLELDKAALASRHTSVGALCVERSRHGAHEIARAAEVPLSTHC
jgi:hypothetical protein